MSMKKVASFSSLALIGSLALAGCGAGSNGLSDSDKQKADDAINAYFAEVTSPQVNTETTADASASSSESASATATASESSDGTNAELSSSLTDIYTKVNDAMITAFTSDSVDETQAQEHLSTLGSDKEVYDSIDKLSDDKKKELADTLQGINPVVDKYDFSDMNDTERAYSNLIALMDYVNLKSTAVSSTDGNPVVTITAPEDKISFDGNEASIKYSDLKVEPDGVNKNTETTLYLHYVDGEWKISNKKAVEDMLESATESESATATDSATTDSSTTESPTADASESANQ